MIKLPVIKEYTANTCSYAGTCGGKGGCLAECRFNSAVLNPSALPARVKRTKALFDLSILGSTKLLSTNQTKANKAVKFGYLQAMLQLQPKFKLKRIPYWYGKEENAFIEALIKELASFSKKVLKQGLLPVVRLNCLSDLRWPTCRAGMFGYSAGRLDEE